MSHPETDSLQETVKEGEKATVREEVGERVRERMAVGKLRVRETTGGED